MDQSCVGDWMGSAYDFKGRRVDYHLFLDDDLSFERVVRWEPDGESRDAGTWEYDAEDRLLALHSRTPSADSSRYDEWWVLSVNTCEASNVLLVLREAILASRNLPILFYRVHGDGRGYGTATQKRLAKQRGEDG